jgi:hypothetical protein
VLGFRALRVKVLDLPKPKTRQFAPVLVLADLGGLRRDFLNNSWALSAVSLRKKIKRSLPVYFPSKALVGEIWKGQSIYRDAFALPAERGIAGKSNANPCRAHQV